MAEERRWDWDETVVLTVVVRVQARPHPDYFEGWEGRTAHAAAVQAVLTAGCPVPSNMDGFADLEGDIWIEDVQWDSTRRTTDSVEEQS